jgi:transforming growth factor-beta-induced protein
MKVLSTLLPLLLSSFVSGQTIPEVIAADTSLSTLGAAITAAGVEGIFTGVNITIFAPTNDAFAALDPALLSKYLEPAWTLHLQYLLSNHLLFNQLAYAATAVDGAIVNSFLSEVLQGSDPWTITVNTAGIFVSGLAFNMSQVIEADIVALDGVIHKVDKVFFPAVLSTNLYDLMVGMGGFSALISVLDSTGLASVIKTETMTLLAPLDAVLGNVPPAALDAYNLTEVLLNHVILGDPIPSESFAVDGFSFTTALGNTYTVSLTNGTAVIGDVPVAIVDLAGSNGLFHALAGVLLPPPTMMNGTEPPVMNDMNMTGPPMDDMTNMTGPPTMDDMMNMTEPPTMDGTEPVSSAPPAAAPVASAAASSRSIVSAVLMVLASCRMMLL